METGESVQKVATAVRMRSSHGGDMGLMQFKKDGSNRRRQRGTYDGLHEVLKLDGDPPASGIHSVAE